jgi:hypothetical protein
LSSPKVGSKQGLEAKRMVELKHGLPNRLGQTKLEGVPFSIPYCSERIRTR